MNQAAGISMPTEANVPKDDWEQVLLDSVAKRGSGHTPDKKHPEYWGGSIKWISLQDSAQLDALYIEDTAATITAEGIKNSSAVLHQKGTVVLSRDAGVGKSAIMADDMAVSQHFMAWTCGQRLDNHFLYYWLQSKKPEFERIANGNTIKTIGLPYFKELTIPLPTVEEQKRIASALSDIDTLISSLDQLVAKKRNIRKATMQQLLTGQSRLPGFSGEWEVRRLGEVFSISTGRSKSAYIATYGDHWIVDMGSVSTDGKLLVSKSTDYKADFLNIGDLVMPKDDIGGGGIIGRVGYIDVDEIYVLSDHVYRLQANCGNPLFLSFAINGYRINSALRKKVIGSAQLGLSRKSVEEQEISLPSLEEQTAIANILSDMDTELATLETRRDKASQLKQGMMQELLTGRIRLTNSTL